MTIAIIGTGFVGVVSAAVYASLGEIVIGLDIDESKIESLKQGKVPFFEPDLEELLKKEQASGNLTFTTQYLQAISNADLVIIAVGTPSAADGQVNLDYVYSAAESMAPFLKEGAIVAIKSTVPPGTLDEVSQRITAKLEDKALNFSMVSMPEFLREGKAVADTLQPDRVVIGTTDDQVFAVLEDLHKPLGAPIIRVNPISAQMAKYSANAYLATRITFINQISDLCHHTGADIEEVIKAIGYDKRIGDHYWYPGFGYGGSCFPKDVKELAHYSRQVGLDQNLLNQLDRLNEERIPKLMSQFASKINGGWTGKKVAVLGLSFKPNTNDMRDAPSIKVIPLLLENGATVSAYDPKSLPEARLVFKDTSKIEFCEDINTACQDADVIIALIEWQEITGFDFSTVRRQNSNQWFIDARNQFEPSIISSFGYQYMGIGR
jgi:UDPglucose 6-dehydrogenase